MPLQLSCGSMSNSSSIVEFLQYISNWTGYWICASCSRIISWPFAVSFSIMSLTTRLVWGNPLSSMGFQGLKTHTCLVGTYRYEAITLEDPRNTNGHYCINWALSRHPGILKAWKKKHENDKRNMRPSSPIILLSCVSSLSWCLFLLLWLLNLSSQRKLLSSPFPFSPFWFFLSLLALLCNPLITWRRALGGNGCHEGVSYFFVIFKW